MDSRPIDIRKKRQKILALTGFAAVNKPLHVFKWYRRPDPFSQNKSLKREVFLFFFSFPPQKSIWEFLFLPSDADQNASLAESAITADLETNKLKNGQGYNMAR